MLSKAAAACSTPRSPSWSRRSSLTCCEPLRRLGLYSRIKPAPTGSFWGPLPKRVGTVSVLSPSAANGRQDAPGAICVAEQPRAALDVPAARRSAPDNSRLQTARRRSPGAFMQPRPLDSEVAMAPVFPRHRAGFASRRARHGDLCAQRSQMRRRRAGSKALRRARLDEDEHLLAGVPGLPPPAAWRPARRAYTPRRRAARGAAAPSPSNRRPPTAPARPGFSHQPLADGAHRRLALQARRPLSASSRSAADVTAPSPRRNPASSGAQGRSPQRLGQRRPCRLHRRGHSGQRVGRRFALARRQALPSRRLEAIRLADGRAHPFRAFPLCNPPRLLPARSANPSCVLRRFICF